MRRPLRSLPFFLPHVVAANIIAGLIQGRPGAFRIIFFAFVATPYLDWLSGVDRTAPTAKDQQGLDESLGWKLAIWSWAPIQTALVLGGFLSVRDLPLQDVIAVGIGVGMACGIFGVTAAHELMHGRGSIYRAGSVFVLSLFSYPHFAIEHVYGHHRNVGTRRDPATARIGESLYTFLPRSVIGGFRSAWRIETRRLRRVSGVSLIHNQLFRQYVVLLPIYCAVGYTFGPNGVLMMAVQSFVAVFLLETLNYVGHYGLVRRQVLPGSYEPIQQRHSWNSSHRVSNWLLFNAGRHSDHHCEPRRGYLSLRHESRAPQLPGGYFAMFVLALFPPLWRRIMDPLVPAVPQEDTRVVEVAR